MPNPKTIEELLEMKPCPFRDFEWITSDKFRSYIKKGLISSEILYSHIPHSNLTISGNEKFSFKMPRGYYHLPPDKQLGLPLGEWHFSDLIPLICSLPFSVICMYCNDSEIAVDENGNYLVLESFTTRYRTFNIKKQPCNLYNPLDHKEEVLMENNSANEELRYQLKCPPKFTPFNPNFFERKFTLDELKALNFQPASCGIMPMSKIDEITNYIGVCFSDQTWGLSEEGITYLNDQITQIIHDHHQPEAEPVKEQPTPTELPWQDISTLNDSDWEGQILLYQPNAGEGCWVYKMESASFIKDFDTVDSIPIKTKWMMIPDPPTSPMVEAPPVEPERVSVQEFAKNPVGKWVTSDGKSYVKWHIDALESSDNCIALENYKCFKKVIANDYPTYATDPSAWLAWKAEQEGNV